MARFPFLKEADMTIPEPPQEPVKETVVVTSTIRKTPILKADEKNSSGRIYTEAAILNWLNNPKSKVNFIPLKHYKTETDFSYVKQLSRRNDFTYDKASKTLYVILDNDSACRLLNKTLSPEVKVNRAQKDIKKNVTTLTIFDMEIMTIIADNRLTTSNSFEAVVR
jgi:hypothetical protein